MNDQRKELFRKPFDGTSGGEPSQGLSIDDTTPPASLPRTIERGPCRVNCQLTELCNEREAACCLGLSIATLRRRRRLKQPPVWVKLGFRVLYRKQDLERFIDANLIHPSQGDVGNV